jgi:hypothetical protein
VGCERKVDRCVAAGNNNRCNDLAIIGAGPWI